MPSGVFLARRGLLRARSAPVISVLATLPAVTGGYLAAYGLSRLITGYAGAALRVQRASDSAQSDIGFDASGLVDMAAAQTFAAGSELRIATLYDQSGNGRHATGSASAPSVLPILTTQRAAYGSGFPARPIILHQGLVYAYPAARVAGLAIPVGLSIDQRNVAFYDVAAPVTASRLSSISGLGGVAGSSRLPLTIQPGQAGLGAFTYTAAGAGPTIATAGYASAPRSNLQVFGLVSRSSGLTVFSEDLTASSSALESKTLTGGHLGGGNGTNASGYYTGDRAAFVVTSGAITNAESDALRAALAGIYGTGKRTLRYILCGSSTPEGRGTSNAVAGHYATESYFRMALGLLDGEIDAWNNGQSGRTAAATLSAFSTEIVPLITPKTIVDIDVGGNDIAVSGDSATTVYGRLKQMVGLARAAGAGKIIVKTLGQRTDLTVGNGKAQVMNDLNAALRSGKADMGYDELVDIDAIVELQNPGAANPYYVLDSDGNYTHRNNAGQLLMAQALAPKLQSLVSALR